MSNGNPPESEIKEMYRIYCHLSTMIHDYAVGKKLQKQKCYSWALTAYYYSLMHSGRFVCYLAIKRYPRGHGELIKWLSAEDAQNHMAELINHNLCQKNISSDIVKIKRLGKILGKSKKLREDNSYELFIVAHQFNHSFLEAQFKSACSLMEKIAKEYLTLCLSFIFEYIQSYPFKDCFISFMKDKNYGHQWAFNSLKIDLEHQIRNKKIVDEVFALLDIELLSKINTELILENSFFEPISFEHYSEKNEIMSTFKQNLDNLSEEYDGQQ